ncbi:proline dehydrogenase family protein [Raineya orbicola]|jgi:proline dehydrogenase|uniref:Proline dehydrogenase n=1 Tax=Raineya orbicola TaxID=2016530 RepID=A0A2N3IKK6_9BACT|nr:proline dehydrogenase family protein [Raineya orbicola]PKQ70743.1 Proline dehydrogenase [Raineya orbicola]
MEVLTQSVPMSFEDTATAFEAQSDSQLNKTYWLFWAMNSNFLVKYGTAFLKFAFKYRLPFVKNIVRNTIFEHFCGGENIEDCEKTIQELAKYHIGAILDYSVEGEKNEKSFDATCEEILHTIEKADHNPNIPFSVFKVTGIARFGLLEKIQAGEKLTESEQTEWERVQKRFDAICRKAYELDVNLLVDGEETWIQDVIDRLTYEAMEKYNKQRAVIYNTYQLYRSDMLDNLKKAFAEAESKGYFLGAKLVRGAYMEKEAERAEKLGYKNPIQPSKESCDRDFNEATHFCMEHLDKISICLGTHNEYSNLLLTQLMQEKGIARDDKRIYFAQLFGMSDQISYALAKAGYNVVKYVPYGPVEAVMPYLFRRAAENTSIAGQSSREFNLVKKECERRKQLKKSA